MVGSQTERRRVIVAHQFSPKFDLLVLRPHYIFHKKKMKRKCKKPFLTLQIPQKNKHLQLRIVMTHEVHEA